MDRNQRKFLLVLGIYVLADFTSVAITNLYLWQLTDNFQIILIFNSFVFTGMAVSSLLAAVWGARIGNKNIFVASMFLYAVQFIIMVLTGAQIVNYLLLLGLVSGFAIGMQSYSFNVLSQEITTTDNRENFLGNKTSLLSFITFLGVPALTYIAATTKTYTPVFLIASVLVILSAVLIHNLRIKEPKHHFQLKLTRNVTLKYSDIRSYFVAKYLFGFQNGLFWVVLGIVTLEFIGNVFAWGLFTSFLTAVSIVTAFIYGRTMHLKQSKYAAIISTFFFASATLVLATNWTFPTFVAYQIMLTLLTVVMAVSFDSFMAKIIEENSETEVLRYELNGFGEFFLNIGRLTPVLLLLLFHFSLVENLYLRIAFTIVAPIPLLIMNRLKKTAAFVT